MWDRRGSTGFQPVNDGQDAHATSREAALVPCGGSYARWVWLGAGVVLALRLAIVPLIRTPWIMADEVVYASMSYRIAHEFEFSARIRAVQPYPPGYPLLLVPATYLGNARAIYAGMLVTNCLLASLAGVIAFYLGRRFLPERDAMFAALIIAVLPSVSVYPYVIMGENLFIPLLLLSCLLVVRAGEERSPLAWLPVGLAVGGLILTRSIGIVILPAAGIAVLLEWLRRRQWLYGMAAVAAFIVGVAALLAPWLLIKTAQQAGPEELTGYHEDTYLGNVVQFLTELRVFKTCLRLGLNQWLAIGLSSGGVFLLFLLDLVVRPSRGWPKPFKDLAAYFFLVAVGITFASLMHMWRGFLLRGERQFALIARYVDPLVPVVVLLGAAGLVRLREGRAGRWARVRLGLLAAGGVAVFLAAFPMDGLKFPNTLSVWFVEPMRDFLDPTGPVEAASPLPTTAPGASAAHRSLGNLVGLAPGVDVRRIVIALAAAVFLFPFIFRRQFLVRRWAGWVIVLLVLFNAPLVLQQVRVSRDADTMNAIPKWMCDNLEAGTRVYFDEGDYYRHKGMYLYYATWFWNPGLRMSRYRRDVAALDPQYVITWDRLGFPVVIESGPEGERRYLLRTEGRAPARKILRDPRYFTIARMPPGDIENAWEVEEGGWVWTKRRTAFRFNYRFGSGPFVLALSGGGPRPRNRPARLRVLLDGHLLRLPTEKDPNLSHTKKPGDAVWRFPVPAGAAAPGDRHVLEILTDDVFVPSRDLTDNPDDRELGIQVFWFKIEE